MRERGLPQFPPLGYTSAPRGDVAQLGERRVRNAKVEGSIPFVSTTSYAKALIRQGLFVFSGLARSKWSIAVTQYGT